MHSTKIRRTSFIILICLIIIFGLQFIVKNGVSQDAGAGAGASGATEAAGGLVNQGISEVSNLLNSIFSFENLSGIVGQIIQSLLSGNQQFIDDLQEDWLPEFYAMTEQISATILADATHTGYLFDASLQSNRQLQFDKAQIKAVYDYQPSAALCKFGTIRTDIAASQFQGQANQLYLAKIAGERDRLKADKVAGLIGAPLKGYVFDPLDIEANRQNQFLNRYCNPAHSGGELSSICGASNAAFRDNDISIVRMIDQNKTLDINLTDGVLTDDEQDIIALMNNLYSYRLSPLLSLGDLRNVNNPETLLNLRSLQAARSIPRNSFAHIIGTKSAGTGSRESTQFISQIVQSMGLDQDAGSANNGGGINGLFPILSPASTGANGDISASFNLGDNPSYDAQMEVLTKTIYQDPNFVTSLIDKPENIKRQEVAILASKLMIDRDIHQALQRRELLISAILNELLIAEEDDVEKALASIK